MYKSELIQEFISVGTVGRRIKTKRQGPKDT